MNLREKMVQDLVPNLKTDDPREKIHILNFLKEYGTDLKIVLKDIAQLLTDTDLRVRLKTCETLKEANHNLNDIIDEIIFAFKNEKLLEVKLALVELMGKSKSDKALPILRELYLTNTNDFIRQVTIESLSFFALEDDLAILIRALNDSASNVRYAAANSLKWFKSDKKIVPLIQALKDEDSIVRASAAWALGTSNRDEKIIDSLIEVLNKEDDEFVRYNIMKAMGEIKDDRFIPSIIEIIRKDIEIKNRLKGIEILGLIGTKRSYEGLIELYKNASTVTIRNKIEFAVKHADVDTIQIIKKISKMELEEKKLIIHQKEIQALHNYRIYEIQNIILNHKSMSIGLLAGLLKIKDETKITNWLSELPEKLGVKLVRDIDYDSIIITIQDDPKTKYDKINQILSSFSKIFGEEE
ncbi:MAG: HEAT repeat domain-containing protein [Candidatus Heimdallarchaeota archaeon]|nr:HEAT repeat domain-containing protein [Candidatus Heimdallarchaeota archaeon]MBY8995117.1 HEAT repeat domain-containing protein [Candidatus Heimdallarchaeota archaeon]